MCMCTCVCLSTCFCKSPLVQVQFVRRCGLHSVSNVYQHLISFPALSPGFAFSHSALSDITLPFDLRATFSRLMVHLHLDRSPQETVNPIELARLWDDIPASLDIAKYMSKA